MFKNIIIFSVLFSIFVISTSVPSSNAALWDLIIEATVESGPVFQGETPIISGRVTDHASNPIKSAQVHITTGQNSVLTTTDESGLFKIELANFSGIPGTYVVNIIATTSDGKTGMMSTDFQIKGTLTPTSAIEEKLSTQEAIKYLNANPSDFEKDPIGLILYTHYQKLLQEYQDEQKQSDAITNDQRYIDQQKIFSEQLLQKEVDELSPGSGDFSGYKYDRYINNLDPSIKDTIVNQINFTKNLFDEAQQIRNNILEKGGTREEANQAYLEKITISRQTMENFGFNNQEEVISLADKIMPYNVTEQLQNNQISEDNVIQTDIAGLNIKVGTNGATFFVNVNGTIIEFSMDGNKIIQIKESDN